MSKEIISTRCSGNERFERDRRGLDPTGPLDPEILQVGTIILSETLGVNGWLNGNEIFGQQICRQVFFYTN